MHFFVSVPNGLNPRLQCSLDDFPTRLATSMDTSVSYKVSTKTKKSIIIKMPEDTDPLHCMQMIRALGFEVSRISP